MSVLGVAAESAGIVAKATSALSWIPWALAAGSLVVGAGGTLWYRSEWKDCQASVAIDANRAHEQLRAQQAADTALRNTLSETLAPIVNDLRKQANDTQVALAKVPSNPNCVRTPAAGAFDTVVQPSPAPDKAGPGRAGAARP